MGAAGARAREGAALVSVALLHPYQGSYIGALQYIMRAYFRALILRLFNIL